MQVLQGNAGSHGHSYIINNVDVNN